MTGSRKRRRSAKSLKKNKNIDADEKGFEIVRFKSSTTSDIQPYFPWPRTTLDCRLNDSEDEYEEEESKLAKMKIKVTYPSRMKNCFRVVKGRRLEEDVVALLSNSGKRDYLVRNNGDRVAVDTIAGKYLLICCFKVPLPYDSEEARICRAMVAAYSHLVSNNENFEMVMVAKMADGHDDDEASFNTFFDTFPCLAVPFSDTESRDYLCKSLALTRSKHQHHAALLLDPDQVVLWINCSTFFSKFGALGFPYSDDRLRALTREDEVMRCRLDWFYYKYRSYIGQEEEYNNLAPVSLVELLGGCNDLLLSRCSGSGDKMSVSELGKKKCLALYLCLDGHYMEDLERIRKACLAENLEFEVVLVMVPFMSDSESYAKAVELALDKYEMSSWWVMPALNEQVNRRLWRLCNDNFMMPWLWRLMDEYIFLADGGNSGELHGDQLMEELGYVHNIHGNYNKLYPFTRKSMLDDYVSRLRSLTLTSLLDVEGYNLVRYVGKKRRRVLVSDLEGRNVLIYVGCPKGFGDYYHLLRQNYPDSQVVFVPDSEYANKGAAEWLELPYPVAVKGSLAGRLFPDCWGGAQEGSVVVAFGEDGGIMSRCGYDDLEDRISEGASLFDDTLVDDIRMPLEIYYRD